MKWTALVAGVLTLGIAAAGYAESAPPLQPLPLAQRTRYFIRTTHDHPLAQVVPNREVKVVVTSDAIVHTCCMPPWLLVSGSITNETNRTFKFVKLVFSFRNASGKTVFTDSEYNHLAVSMNDGPEVQRILKEKPHFIPLAPGGSDTFSYQIPTPDLPQYASVEVTSKPTVSKP